MVLVNYGVVKLNLSSFKLKIVELILWRMYICDVLEGHCFDEMCRLQGLLPTQQSKGDVAASLVPEVSHPNSAMEVGAADISLGPQSELLASNLVSAFGNLRATMPHNGSKIAPLTLKLAKLFVITSKTAEL
ncbi:hypothetical protein Acr_25g0010490 [Actinidia rufa]|uniref:Uncharacterized protein n=1 Tax=Actinidia rufa TaxID=165716 RepID=A0A7J0H0M3_9ERIC|nr:hypothetical protein Acr_25g0010490 [Actinidia rufa]